jgi:hypothetical protein
MKFASSGVAIGPPWHSTRTSGFTLRAPRAQESNSPANDKTLSPFFFKPGNLTKTYNAGKRQKYTHPIRLYLIFSLFYFFIIGLVIPKNFLDDVFSQDFSSFETDTIQKIEDLSADEQEEIRSVLSRSAAPYTKNNGTAFITHLRDTIERRHTWKELKYLALDRTVSSEEFGKALEQSNFSIGLNLSMEQKRNFVANSNMFIAQSAKNLPLMMFALLPFFALLLKLLFSRTGHYYIEHLIHGLHLHAFAYTMYGLAILIYLVSNMEATSYVFKYSFFIVTIYAYISVWKVHRQHWFKTLFKFLLLGFFYVFILTFGVITELYISLLLL